jgi:hypothetical protein
MPGGSGSGGNGGGGSSSSCSSSSSSSSSSCGYGTDSSAGTFGGSDAEDIDVDAFVERSGMSEVGQRTVRDVGRHIATKLPARDQRHPLQLTSATSSHVRRDSADSEFDPVFDGLGLDPEFDEDFDEDEFAGMLEAVHDAGYASDASTVSMTPNTSSSGAAVAAAATVVVAQKGLRPAGGGAAALVQIAPTTVAGGIPTYEVNTAEIQITARQQLVTAARSCAGLVVTHATDASGRPHAVGHTRLTTMRGLAHWEGLKHLCVQTGDDRTPITAADTQGQLSTDGSAFCVQQTKAPKPVAGGGFVHTVKLWNLFAGTKGTGDRAVGDITVELRDGGGAVLATLKFKARRLARGDSAGGGGGGGGGGAGAGTPSLRAILGTLSPAGQAAVMVAFELQLKREADEALGDDREESKQKRLRLLKSQHDLQVAKGGGGKQRGFRCLAKVPSALDVVAGVEGDLSARSAAMLRDVALVVRAHDSHA